MDVDVEYVSEKLYPEDIIHIIQHNFSGQKNNAALDIFARHLRHLQRPEAREGVKRTMRVQELVRRNLCGVDSKENRFLLLLTHNSAALRLLRGMEELKNAEVIFGSRFPQDLEYTQICRNINRIRLAMNDGRKVILLNLETLYESLYELLNQSYTEMKGNKFVEIGLGTHRHRTRVDPDFRLIVVAESDEVRRAFPAALVNRLEKHAYFLHTDMAPPQIDIAQRLRQWTDGVTNPSKRKTRSSQRFEVEDVFVGFTPDAIFSLVSDRYDMVKRDLTDKEDLPWLKEQLIHTCVPEGVLRMKDSDCGVKLPQEPEWASSVYFDNSLHTSLIDLLPSWLTLPSDQPMLQITSYQTQILSIADKEALSQATRHFNITNVNVWQLQQFNTEQAFEAELKSVFGDGSGERKLLLIQCVAAQQHPKLIASCRFMFPPA